MTTWYIGALCHPLLALWLEFHAHHRTPKEDFTGPNGMPRNESILDSPSCLSSEPNGFIHFSSSCFYLKLDFLWSNANLQDLWQPHGLMFSVWILGCMSNIMIFQLYPKFHSTHLSAREHLTHLWFRYPGVDYGKSDRLLLNFMEMMPCLVLLLQDKWFGNF